ncbi:FAD-dependent oxidoreductase [Leptolyngbya ohadii]|uniref:FAD-dependent oxidoreductase n=1 Tax=Leptolyngbya ohadii TaxID=1962290 RepID=UPI001CED01AD|nr:FAD-dependent oxidoreductase [Leptolyngbya ohadii]
MSQSPLRQLALFAFLIPVGATGLLGALQYYSWGGTVTPISSAASVPDNSAKSLDPEGIDRLVNRMNGRPTLKPLPEAKEVWECEVVVLGGTMGGVSAAAQSMRSGAKTCLIELTPWLGGQISSQGVSALDESVSMNARGNLSPDWIDFKRLVKDQQVEVPPWTNLASPQNTSDLNSCWVATLCFLPKAGEQASEQWLQQAATQSPESKWTTSTAFKGATFDPTGRLITSVYAVRRIPKNPGYVPLGRPSKELPVWYSWSPNDQFDKVPMRLQPPAGKQMIVIDATDTGEFLGWAGIPYRLGSEGRSTTSEYFASQQDNPDCTQAFTFPFGLGILDDGKASQQLLAQVQPGYPKAEHRAYFDMEGFPMFGSASVFNYRRILSTTSNDSRSDDPAPGDISMLNWNRGNDWPFMDPPLILNEKQITELGQHENWLGGLSLSALRHGEEHALLFAEWLMETQSKPGLPMTYLYGIDMPMGTASGLSMMPYIREGRRMLGRNGYGQVEFMLREADIRTDMRGGRDFRPTAIALTHYPIDMHGCRYRNQSETWEASSAPLKDEHLIKPIYIPLEAIVPQEVDNLLIGGKSIAASHIVNGATRLHYGEWVIGGAAGATAGWLANYNRRPNHPYLLPPEIIRKNYIGELQTKIRERGFTLDW